MTRVREAIAWVREHKAHTVAIAAAVTALAAQIIPGFPVEYVMSVVHALTGAL
ncbi:hypothetical protein [Streptomyces sp. NPDC007063]|uniref:hypothetical protein n=1 Tax=Streptomyces sp. NPDC007063 TaxID=3364772 RepID=UPI00369E5A1A